MRIKSITATIHDTGFGEAMKLLAFRTGLTHDGGDDTRLFTDRSDAETLQLTKKEYSAMEKEINNFSIKGKGFEVYAWNDCSGYNYWTEGQEENNYIQITASILNPFAVDVSELKDAIKKAEIHFAKYRPDFYFDI